MTLGVLFALTLAACSAAHTKTRLVDGQPPDRSMSRTNQERLQALWLSRQRGDARRDYIIAAGDLLIVTIYNFRPDGGHFETDVRVDDEGHITLPILDPVGAAGLSCPQLRAALVEELRRARMLQQPMVSVFLKDYQGQAVVVLGAVARPGLYHLSRGTQTLVDVLSMAGGLTSGAGNYLLFGPGAALSSDHATASLIQGYATRSQTAPESGAQPDSDMIRIPAHDGSTDTALLTLPVRGGDLIIVPEAGQAFVEGEVAKPGPFLLVHGMTLTQLISGAGGLTYPANHHQVELIRGAPAGTSAQYVVDLDRIQRQERPDILLERNDRIVVPASTGRKLAYGFYETFTSIVRFTVGGAANVY